MPSPQNGTAGNLVSPAIPREAQEADVADPGEVAETKAQQQQLGSGKYGEVPVKPFKPWSAAGDAADGTSAGDSAKPVTWIAIQLNDQAGQPVTGERYRIEMPDGTIAEGTLDEKGAARIDGIPDPGSCKNSFPALDQDAWDSA
jgi:hypothetical protein